MDKFSTEVARFMLDCTGMEPLQVCLSGVSVCIDALGRLAVIVVPLDFFRMGGTVECLREVMAVLSETQGGFAAGTDGEPDRVFLYEDRWRDNGHMVRAMLKARLGQGVRVYARNCEVRTMAPEAAAAFLQRNHVYGSARARYRLGLFRVRATGMAEVGMEQTPSLVAVATFSAGRQMYNPAVSYEWVRYAPALGVRVIGGMGRLLKAFVGMVRDDNPMDVMTYADLEWYDGRSYLKLGFEPCGERAPIWFQHRSGEKGRIVSNGLSAAEGRAVRICNTGSRKYVLRFP